MSDRRSPSRPPPPPRKPPPPPIDTPPPPRPAILGAPPPPRGMLPMLYRPRAEAVAAERPDDTFIAPRLPPPPRLGGTTAGPIGNLCAIAAEIPNSALVIIPKAYHAFTLEKGALTAELLARFAENVLAG